ncbi:unnamed protein product [Gordionus sp. m RMFG-2023]
MKNVVSIFLAVGLIFSANEFTVTPYRVCHVCELKCEFGWIMGPDDCPLCKCKPNPWVCNPICNMKCPSGNSFRKCPVCDCNAHPGNLLLYSDFYLVRLFLWQHFRCIWLQNLPSNSP